MCCRFFRRLCFSDDGGLFSSSAGILFIRSESILTHHVAPLSITNYRSSFLQSDWDATAFSWGVLVGSQKIFWTCLSRSPFDPIYFCATPTFLPVKSMFAAMTLAQLPSCSYDRAFGLRPLLFTLLYNSQGATFLLELLNRTSSTRENLNFPEIFFLMLCEIDVAGIADPPCRRCPFAMDFSENALLGCDPLVWRLQPNYFVSLVRSQPFPCAWTHTSRCKHPQASPFSQSPW